MLKMTLAAIVLTLAHGIANAQHGQPYAGLQERPIKALSAEQIGDLRAGRGMGLALAAELNGYPGPIHVIELADALELQGDQRARIDKLLAAMKAEAIPLGERLIVQEASLDREFADGTISEASLVGATEAIGSTQASLRAAHLRYHLLTVQVLTPAQAKRYAELRGYALSEPVGHGHDRHGRPD